MGYKTLWHVILLDILCVVSFDIDIHMRNRSQNTNIFWQENILNILFKSQRDITYLSYIYAEWII